MINIYLDSVAENKCTDTSIVADIVRKLGTRGNHIIKELHMESTKFLN